MSMLRFGFSVIALGVITPGMALAATPWSPDNGATSLFSYSGAFNNTNLFGNPVLSGNTFIFSPTAFVAQSISSPATAVDYLQVFITVQPGQTITGVNIRESGTRTSTVFTTLQGTLTITDLTNPGLNETNANVDVVNEVGSPTPWVGTASINGLNYVGGNVFKLTLTNQLTAILGANILKNGVEVEIVPAPGAAALLGLGGLAMARRRRR